MSPVATVLLPQLNLVRKLIEYMIKQLKQYDRLNETVFLGSVAFCAWLFLYSGLYILTRYLSFPELEFVSRLPSLAFQHNTGHLSKSSKKQADSNRINPFMVVVLSKFTLYLNRFISPGIIPIHADLV